MDFLLEYNINSNFLVIKTFICLRPFGYEALASVNGKIITKRPQANKIFITRKFEFMLLLYCTILNTFEPVDN